MSEPSPRQTNRLTTTTSDDPPEVEGFPMRRWEISIYLVGPDGEDVTANCFERAVYMLHESFGKRMKQSMLGVNRRAMQVWDNC